MGTNNPCKLKFGPEWALDGLGSRHVDNLGSVNL